jgi:hexokinase
MHGDSQTILIGGHTYDSSIIENERVISPASKEKITIPLKGGHGASYPFVQLNKGEGLIYKWSKVFNLADHMIQQVCLNTNGQLLIAVAV